MKQFEFDPEAFGLLNQEAASIAEQNARYIQAGDLRNRRYGREQQQIIAADQAASVETLGELVDELPYADLPDAYEGALREYEIQRLAVVAWAGRLADTMPTLSSAIEARTAERLAEIDDRQKAFENGEVNPSDPLGKIALAYQVVSQPWPVPTAYPIEDFPDTPEIPEIAPKNGVPPVFPTTETDGTFFIEQEEPEPQGHKQDVAGPNRQYQLDQPRASELAAAFLIGRSPAPVAPAEMVDALYAHVLGQRDPERLNRRAAALFQPTRECRSIGDILDEKGYVLVRGWRAPTQDITGNGRERPSKKRRAYQAVLRQDLESLPDDYEEKTTAT